MMFAEELFLVNGKYTQLISLGLFLQSVVGKRFFQKVTRCVPLSPPTVGRSCCLQSVLSKQTRQPRFPSSFRSGQGFRTESVIAMGRTQSGLLDSGQSSPLAPQEAVSGRLGKLLNSSSTGGVHPSISQGLVGAEVIITKPLHLS